MWQTVYGIGQPDLPVRQGVPPAKLDGPTEQQQADDPTLTADRTGRASTKLLRKAIDDVRLEAEANKSGSGGSTGNVQRKQSSRSTRLPTQPGDKATKPLVRTLALTQHCKLEKLEVACPDSTVRYIHHLHDPSVVRRKRSDGSTLRSSIAL